MKLYNCYLLLCIMIIINCSISEKNSSLLNKNIKIKKNLNLNSSLNHSFIDNKNKIEYIKNTNKNIHTNRFLSSFLKTNLNQDESSLISEKNTLIDSKNEKYIIRALTINCFGIITFLVSVYYLCNLERNYVKETNYLDLINNKEKCVHIDCKSVDSIKKNDKRNIYIVSGTMKIKEPAKFNELSDLEINEKLNFDNKDNVILIKIEIDVLNNINNNNLKHNNNKNILKSEYLWIPKVNLNKNNNNNNNNNLSTKYYYSKPIVNENYNFDSSKFINLMNNKKCSNILEYLNYKELIINDSNIDIIRNYIKYYMPNEDNYKIVYQGNNVYIIRESTRIDYFVNRDEGINLLSSNLKLFPGDLKLKVKYVRSIILIIKIYLCKFIYILFKLELQSSKELPVTLIGGLEYNLDNNCFSIVPFETNIEIQNYSVCAPGSNNLNKYYNIDDIFIGNMTREEIVNHLKSISSIKMWIYRIIIFVLNLISFLMIIYSINLLLGHVPAIGNTDLTAKILISLYFSVVITMIILSCLWIYARPKFSVITFAVIIILVLLSKSFKEIIKQSGHIND